MSVAGGGVGWSGAHFKNGFTVLVELLLTLARLVLGVLRVVVAPGALCGNPCPGGMVAVHPGADRRRGDATVFAGARAIGAHSVGREGGEVRWGAVEAGAATVGVRRSSVKARGECKQALLRAKGARAPVLAAVEPWRVGQSTRRYVAHHNPGAHRGGWPQTRL